MARIRARAGLGGLAAGSLILGMIATAGPVAAAQTWSIDAGTGDATGVAGLKFYQPALTVDVGDTVTWTFKGNAHTVSFLGPGVPTPSPEDPSVGAPAGGPTFNGTTTTSSGIVPPVPGSDTYALTFTAAGTFKYLCLIHPGMEGTVTVNAAGTAYPQDQAAITAAAQAAEAADLATGHELAQNYETKTTSNGDGTKTFHLAAGVGVPGITVLRFITSTLDVKVGDTVEWINVDGSGEPHSVSFGPEPQDETAVAPAGGSTYAGGSGFVSSGLYLADPLPGPHTYSLKFTKAGSYAYICVLHDIVGMTGTINVAARASTTPPPTASSPSGPSSGGGDLTLPILVLAAVAGALALAGFELRRRRLA